nr:unnamed protein product [Digitaria exilis]
MSTAASALVTRSTGCKRPSLRHTDSSRQAQQSGKCAQQHQFYPCSIRAY